MAKPKITLYPEPKQGEVLTFQLLAPERSGKSPVAQLSFLLRIRNNEAVTVVLTNIAFEVFSPDASEPQRMSNPVRIAIPAGGTGVWHNRVYMAESKHTAGLASDTYINQNMVVRHTANIINITLKFRDFDEPVKRIYALRPHQSPTPKGAYQFPAKKADLLENEFWSGAGAVHQQSTDGCQLFGLDLGVSGWDKETNSWSHLLPKGIESRNEDHRIWGKPIFAMADGVVRDVRWDFPNNEKASNKLAQSVVDLMNSLGDGNGNFVTIRTGDEVHLYAHLIKDTTPPRFRAVGAEVSKGDLIGYAGNSGNSSGPHLHIDVRSSRRVGVVHGGATGSLLHVLRPMPFVDMHSIHSAEMRGGFRPEAPWFKHSKGYGLCRAAWPNRCLIWPSRTLAR